MRTKPILGPLAALTAFALLVTPLACDSGSPTMPNPLVRVDLSQRIDAKTQKLLPAAIDLDCHRKFTLGHGDKAQSFVVNWRVADLKGKRYLTAVDVAPAAGPTKGKASASVGANAKDGQSVPITVHWELRSGCSSAEGNRLITIRTQHRSCKGSQPKDLLKKSK